MRSWAFAPPWASPAGPGVAPLYLSADIAGPMTRTVADAAVVFQVIVGKIPTTPSRPSVVVVAGRLLGGAPCRWTAWCPHRRPSPGLQHLPPPTRGAPGLSRGTRRHATGRCRHRRFGPSGQSRRMAPNPERRLQSLQTRHQCLARASGRAGPGQKPGSGDPVETVSSSIEARPRARRPWIPPLRERGMQEP